MHMLPAMQHRVSPACSLKQLHLSTDNIIMRVRHSSRQNGMHIRSRRCTHLSIGNTNCEDLTFQLSVLLRAIVT